MRCVIYPKIYLVALLTCLIFAGCTSKKEDGFKNSEEYNKAMNVISNEVANSIIDQQVCTQVPSTMGGNLNSPIK